MTAPSRLAAAAGRRARVALRSLRARAEQAAIVASSGDAHVGVSRQGRITSWNPAAERLYGYRPSEAAGLPVERLFATDRTGELQGLLARAGAGEHVPPFDTQGRRRDGSVVDVAVVVSPIHRRGRVVGAVLGARDIRGRQQAERRLRAEQERYRAVIETARNAFLAMDEAGRITAWNRRAEELFGWPREEIIGRRLTGTIVPPPQRAGLEEDLRRFLTTGESDIVGRTRETTAQRRDGTILPVEISVWHLEEEGTHSFNAFVQDISERRRIGELQGRVAAIVESSDEAIVGLSRDLVVTLWNPGAERLYGYPAEEALGRRVDFLIVGGTRSALLEEVLAGRRFSSLETQARAKDGRVVPILLSASPVLDPAGTVVGISSVAHDITERRAMRAALAAARDDALEAARLKSQFLATMSHEIRTPMNGVIGLTGLLLDTALDPLQRRYAEGIRNAGEGLLAVINDILDFSKIEAGKLELEAIDFDLAPLVEEVAELVAEAARAKGLEILAGCDPGCAGRFRGDANRLRQVLLNLVGNAVKFTAEGEVVVRSALDGEAEGRAVVRFEVRDTGIGISPERAGRLFQPFSQADASTTRRFGGTGLGLAISAQLVEAMGGTIGLDSEEGRGSTFWFTVPLERRPDRDAARPLAHLLGGVRVLVADDNESNRLILRTQLRSWGLRPRVVDGGAAAISAATEAAAAGEPYRVVVTDHQMPDVDGIEVARRISADPATAGTPILLLTSGGGVDADAAAAAGVAARLTKPVRQSDLYDLLLRVVAGPELEAGRAVPPPSAPAASEAPSRGRILVAEDNDINQMVALGVLAKLGYEADVVGDGSEAVDAAAAGGYAAILMDCHMPGVDGYEATARIRAAEGGSGRHIPIIAMTAGVLVEDRERALAAGMDDYVAKPVEVDDLDAVLARWATAVGPGPGGSGEAGLAVAAPAEGGLAVAAPAEGGPAVAAPAEGGPAVAAPAEGGPAVAAPAEGGPAVAAPAEGGPGSPAPEGGAPGERPALDPDRLDMLRRLGPADGLGLLPQLARSFLTEAPALGSALRHLVTSGEAAPVREAAHRLRGSAANVGAAPLADACADLEELAAAGDLSGAAPVLDRLEGELTRAQRELAALLPPT